MSKLKQLSIEEQLNIMSAYALTAEEWLVTELLFVAIDDEGDAAPLYKYFNECKKDTLPIDTIQSLKNKKVFSSTYRIPAKGEVFDIDQVEFSESFLTNYFKSTFEGGKELFESYPDFLQANDGRLLPARNITTKGFLSLEAFFQRYMKNIRHSRKKHEEVMDILEWAKEQGLLGYGIGEYVITKRWEDHIKMRDAGGTSQFIVKANTLEHL